jgi:hypothetical protein
VVQDTDPDAVMHGQSGYLARGVPGDLVGLVGNSQLTPEDVAGQAHTEFLATLPVVVGEDVPGVGIDPTTYRARTRYPVSSKVSRTAVSEMDSPGSITPPGNAHIPCPGVGAAAGGPARQ